MYLLKHKSEINNTSSQSLNIDLLISEMRLEKVLSTLGQTNWIENVLLIKVFFYKHNGWRTYKPFDWLFWSILSTQPIKLL